MAEREADLSVGLAEARAELSGLVKHVETSRKGIVGIQVHGRTKAYLVSARRLTGLLEAQQAPKKHRPLKGSLELMVDPDEIETILKKVHEEEFAHLLSELDEP